MSIEQIMNEMSQDVRTDIYGDIHGLYSWAEEIFRLRQEVKNLREKAIEDSWKLYPDRIGGQFTDQEILDADRNMW